MKPEMVYRICYAVCILAIFGGFTTGMLMIWTEISSESSWRFLMTFLVILLTAGSIIAVTKAVMQRSDR